MQVLQDRDYVRLDKRRFVPEDRGRLVTAFLTSFFERYVEYNFTADLENQLDDISGGRIDWKEVLRNFWREFSAAVDGTKDLTIGQVLTALDEELGRHFFPDDGSGKRPAPLPGLRGRQAVSLKLGRFGAFIGCSNYPNCRYTRALGIESEEDGKAAAIPDTALGTDPERPAGRAEERPVRAIHPARRPARTATSPSGSRCRKRNGPRRNQSRYRAEAARAAARDRPPSRERRGDHRRHRPLRPLHQARHEFRLARAATTTC